MTSRAFASAAGFCCAIRVAPAAIAVAAANTTWSPHGMGDFLFINFPFYMGVRRCRSAVPGSWARPSPAAAPRGDPTSGICARTLRVVPGRTWASYLGVVLGRRTWASYLGVVLRALYLAPWTF